MEIEILVKPYYFQLEKQIIIIIIIIITPLSLPISNLYLLG